jgi:hypothetical protein
MRCKLQGDYILQVNIEEHFDVDAAIGHLEKPLADEGWT